MGDDEPIPQGTRFQVVDPKCNCAGGSAGRVNMFECPVHSAGGPELPPPGSLAESAEAYIERVGTLSTRRQDAALAVVAALDRVTPEAWPKGVSDWESIRAYFSSYAAT